MIFSCLKVKSDKSDLETEGQALVSYFTSEILEVPCQNHRFGHLRDIILKR